MNLIKEIIQSVLPISDNSVRKISAIIQTKSIPSGETFIELNKINKEEYFLLKGIVRSYLRNPEGEDVTISFFKEGSVISPNLIRVTNGKSNLNFETLTDTELAVIHAEEFHQLMLQNEEVRDFANKVLELELVNKVQKEIGFASLTARERLLLFRKNYPNFENLIPHPIIASFLGITNTSFSRLRKELVKS